MERPIVTTKTAIFPTLFFLRGLNKNSSRRPPKKPHVNTARMHDIEKLSPKGGIKPKNSIL